MKTNPVRKSNLYYCQHCLAHFAWYFSYYW